MDLNPITIRRGLRLGDLEAETDIELLSETFIDNGELPLLEDVQRAESIIVGRTGAGKSALLIELASRAHAFKILDPNDISVRFLESSDIIQFFETIGVNLDLFYKLLWRHILTIELLKIRYSLKSETDSNGVWQRLTGLVERDEAKKKSLSYFKEWGGKFWLETEEQLKEITEKLSKDIKTGFGAELQGVDMSVTGAKSLTEERKSEIIQKANRVVSTIQIQKLAGVLDLLEDQVFDDSQKNYFILIDKLDEEWAETETRYRFIRALIEEIKTFRKIGTVKIIISIRRDLLEIVFDKTRSAGFQQEKYESYLVPIIWTRDSLRRMIESRINVVFKKQYTRENVLISDLFPSIRPSKAEGRDPIDYILDRTFLRPRDTLQFINECFHAAINSPRISWRAISEAETRYSERRLNSLYEEWGDVYPAIQVTLEILRGAPSLITRSYIKEKIETIVDRLMDFPNDPCGKSINDYCSDNNKDVSEADIVAVIVCCLFRIGVIGVKQGKTTPYAWSDYDNTSLSHSTVKRIEHIKIHKIIHKALEIREYEGASGLL